MRKLLVAACLACASAAGAADPIIARFSAVETIRTVQLSPSGRRLLVVRPGADGRHAVEVRETADLAAGGLDFGAEPAEIRDARWLTDDRILVFLRERVKRSDGPGFWGDFLAVFNDRGELQYRMPGEDPQILSLHGAGSGAIYVAYDSTGDGSADVHRLDVATGRSERIFRGNNRRFGFQVDRRGEVRVSTTFDPGAFEVTYWSRASGSDGWTKVATLSPRDRKVFRVVGFHTDSDDELVVIAQQEKNTAGLHVYDLKAGRITRTLYENAEVDVEDVVLSRDGRLLGARYSTDRPRIAWLDPARAALARPLEAALPGRLVRPSDRTPAGLAVVTASGPGDPGSYHLLDAGNRLRLLGVRFPALADLRPAPVSLTRFKVRDGLTVPLYVTRPARASGPLPLVVLPHGGPWTRDESGWDEWAQMLAARGYMVAQPQFRGSLGFGRAHWLAGDREWGGRMQDDLDDTVKHLIATGAADPRRVAMFGWSYGGYAALTAAWRGNGLYRCAIAGAAVSDLDRINAGLAGDFVLRRIQKPTIAGPSPVNKLAAASIPTLVIHGDIDAVVPVGHGRDAARALKTAGTQHRYVEVKGLDHQLDKFSAEHKRQVYGEVDAWLRGPCAMAG